MIEEVHKTRTTIIDLDSDTEEPVKNVEKVSQRQKTLNDLQNKLKRIKPVGNQGSLKTYVNAAEPKLVDEPIEVIKTYFIPRLSSCKKIYENYSIYFYVKLSARN